MEFSATRPSNATLMLFSSPNCKNHGAGVFSNGVFVPHVLCWNTEQQIINISLILTRGLRRRREYVPCPLLWTFWSLLMSRNFNSYDQKLVGHISTSYCWLSMRSESNLLTQPFFQIKFTAKSHLVPHAR